MRILFLSNFYPPTLFGGYEIRCREVAEGMQARGHEIQIATSNHGSPYKSVEEPIHRILTSFWDLPNSPQNRSQYIRAVADDTARLQKLVQCFDPDVISFWNMMGLAYAVPSFAMNLGLPVLLHIEDDWLLQTDHTLSKFGPINKESVLNELGDNNHFFPLEQPADQYFSATFGSRYRYDRHTGLGKCATSGTIIHGGIDTKIFDSCVFQRFEKTPPSKFLFVGAHTQAKGPHLAVQAMAKLPENASLSLAGFTTPSPYLDELKSLPTRLGLKDRISFLGPISKQQLIEAYATHDVLVFTSTAPEGFPITLHEAMGMGMAVITSLTGGHEEYIEHEHNSLVFETGIADSLAEAMSRLMNSPKLAMRLAEAGRNLVQNKFKLTDMLDAQETCLQSVASNKLKNACSLR